MITLVTDKILFSNQSWIGKETTKNQRTKQSRIQEKTFTRIFVVDRENKEIKNKI